MASLKGPLFSLSASGAIAKTLVYGRWKGVKTVRQHVDPANPNTADQAAQRTIMTDTVAAWKNYFTDAEGRAAWNRSALNDSRPLSGFNMFTSQAVKMTAITVDASFCDSASEQAGRLTTFSMLNVDDGAAGDEAGVFEIWIGDTISGMVLTESIAIAAGDVVSTIAQGVADDIKYAKLRKDSLDRSGIFRLTMVA